MDGNGQFDLVVGNNNDWVDGQDLGAVYILFLNHLIPDTDNDAIPDSWEFVHGLNPSLNDASNDPDGDGYTNLMEFKAKTNPFEKDSDDDGISDGEETSEGSDGYLTNPNSADTDVDGLTDLEETTIGLDGYFTNPTLNDTDGDSYSDYTEYLAGTDPTNPDSNPGVPETVTVTVTFESDIPIYVIALLSTLSLASLAIILKKKYKKQ